MFSALSLVEFWVTHASEDLPHDILVYYLKAIFFSRVLFMWIMWDHIWSHIYVNLYHTMLVLYNNYASSTMLTSSHDTMCTFKHMESILRTSISIFQHLRSLSWWWLCLWYHDTANAAILHEVQAKQLRKLNRKLPLTIVCLQLFHCSCLLHYTCVSMLRIVFSLEVDSSEKALFIVHEALHRGVEEGKT